MCVCAQRELGQTMAEKSGLAELSKKTEEEAGRLEVTKSQLLERVENAEARGRELQHAKDAAFAERSRSLQQLAVLTSEKNASDEAVMRLQGQLREERGTLTVRCETAEAACREVTRDRDAMAEEKARLGEQMAVLTVEKRETDARASQLEKTLQLAQEERGAMQVRSEGAENRLRDMDALKESMVAERQKLEQEMAVASSERRRIEEACARTLPPAGRPPPRRPRARCLTCGPSHPLSLGRVTRCRCVCDQGRRRTSRSCKRTSRVSAGVRRRRRRA